MIDGAALAARVQTEVRATLGVRVHVAVHQTGDTGDDARLGRTALAEALAAAGRPGEPPATWPCRFASVSHSRGVAIAVVLDAADDAAGLGVDLELDRAVRPGLASVFCDARERAWLASRPAAEHDGDVLRLWTAKEALYKADPAQGDAIVAEYAVAVPALDGGGRPHGGPLTRLCTLRLDGAAVSVAVFPSEDRRVAATW